MKPGIYIVTANQKKPHARQRVCANSPEEAIAKAIANPNDWSRPTVTEDGWVYEAEHEE